MAEISRYERVLNRIATRVERVSTKIARDSHGVKPFDKPMPDPREELYMWETTSPEVKDQFKQMYPLEFAKMSLKMDTLRSRYGRQ